MSGDLIRRQDAISALKALEESAPTAQHVSAIFDCEDTIRALPSAGPEQKKGKWIDGMLYHNFDESEWEKVKCSVCGYFVTKQIFYHDNKYHYCPYCGAEMNRGE